ncbi:hypothetical protein Oweho_0597 [Owenweeksia hongkongensis DSM 17368]|uniref:Uncharacterized protein n=1 Tax=Owenweeksia hongkongensis (strain DSM 17368 / CIP 108786 / JCM 12287 / NRRL B-23963 / UST20020801) TaxID=926562 RepID=G8R0F2_OWEHD|nr:kelch repeat-containing protein [Owenweeksia hongkongensis]AEV31612.1 hypothetical protein Oweho_0597 [Owenweeksia hongkongensis DSM 17368]
MKNLYTLLLIPTFLMFHFSSLGQAILITDSMAVPRVLHEVQTLPNGKVLVMGGINNTQGPTVYHIERSCEIYDPATGQWSMTDSLMLPRSKFTTVVTNGGKVLVIGGETTSQGQVLNVESFDPATEKWSVVGTLPSIISNCDAIVTSTGEILVVRYLHYYKGNADGSTWTEETPSNHVSSGERPQLFQMNNGKILSIGSQPSGNDFAVEYNNFTATTSSFMVDDQTGTNMAQLPSGQVLVAGSGSRISEIYDPTNGSFTSTASSSRIIEGELMPMTDGRIAAMVQNDILGIGGPGTKILEIYDPNTNMWTASSAHYINNPIAVRSVAMGNGKYLICGGIDNGGFHNSGSRAAYIFDENASPAVSLLENAIIDLLLVRNGFNQFKVEGNLESLRMVNSVAIYNTGGQLIDQQNLSPSNPIFEVRSLARGIYIFLLVDKAGQNIYRQKMTF